MGQTQQPQFPNTVHLTCKDIRRTIAFYKDVLGFQLKECWPDQDKPMFASLILDGQSMLLGAAMDAAAVGEMCAHDPAGKAIYEEASRDFAKHKPGVGVVFYFLVPDVDAHHRDVVERGGKPANSPTTQFYGLRDYVIRDPDGYQVNPYTNVVMSSCQSCGMPLTDSQPGQMYCQYCTDEQGKLRPYEQVLEGTVQGYFMAMQKMPRPNAEVAAKEHLKKMPAWAGRS